MSDMLKVSSSPRVRAKDTTDKIMLYVILALLPTSLFGVYNFGIRALILIIITILSCMASEWAFENHKASEYAARPECGRNGSAAGIKPSGFSAVLAGSFRRRICDRCRKDAVWRAWAEFYEPSARRSLLPAHLVYWKHDSVYI